MGLVTGLLTLPLAPVRGVVWIAEQLQTAAEREFSDPAAIRRRIEALEQAHARGELSDEQRDELEGELVERLLQARGHGVDPIGPLSHG